MTLFERSGAAEDAQARRSAEECRRRLKADPTDVSAALGLAEALASTGGRREAVAVLSRTGAALQKKGKPLEAIAVWKKVGQVDPKGEVTSTFIVQIDLKKLMDAARSPAESPAPPIQPGTAPAGATPAGGVPAGTKPPDLEEQARLAAIRRKKETVRQAVAGIPLLKDVPPFLFELLLEKISLRTAEGGETVFEEGTPGGSLLFVVSGALSVTSKDDAGQEVLLGRLGPGDVAGEISFLSGVSRTATLTAVGRADLLELERKAVDPILKKHRSLGDALNALHKERVLDGVLARSRLFSSLPREERDWVAQRLLPLSARPGEKVVRQGASDNALYVLRRGEVRVTTMREGKEVALALLKPHDFFGDVAALRGTARTASVTAVTPVELLGLSKGDLDELVARHPRVRELLEEIQLERFVANSGTLART